MSLVAADALDRLSNGMCREALRHLFAKAARFVLQCFLQADPPEGQTGDLVGGSSVPSCNDGGEGDTAEPWGGGRLYCQSYFHIVGFVQEGLEHCFVL